MLLFSFAALVLRRDFNHKNAWTKQHHYHYHGRKGPQNRLPCTVKKHFSAL